MSDIDKAKDTVSRLISKAQLDALDRYEHALYRIARLRWWQVFQAADIAAEVLGVGRYSPHLRKK